MIGLFYFVLAVLASPFKSRVRVEAENAVLRHQLIVLMRRPRGRVQLTNHDRWFFIQIYRLFRKHPVSTAGQAVRRRLTGGRRGHGSAK